MCHINNIAIYKNESLLSFTYASKTWLSFTFQITVLTLICSYNINIANFLLISKIDNSPCVIHFTMLVNTSALIDIIYGCKCNKLVHICVEVWNQY